FEGWKAGISDAHGPDMNVRRLQAPYSIALLLVSVAGTTTACATGELTKPFTAGDESEWNCERVDVPMGEVTRCTSGSGNGSTGAALPETTGGGTVKTIALPSQAKPDVDCKDAEAPPPAPPPPPPPPPEP